ncbi:MAG TPA: hypothetical protein PK073_08840 [Ignavibacteriaceae bacterium]|nr:hypothetical protein [Ignavibacteriaceae bacterium]
MITIKSLNRIVEAENDYDIRYRQDIQKAKEAYQKAKEADNTWKYTPWFLSPGGKKTAEAHYDYHSALDAAEARRKAAKMGMVSKQDYDESRYQAARAAAKARSLANDVKEQQLHDSDNRPGVIRKIGGAIADHPLLAVGTVAGLAGLAALQKRKRHLPEPGKY